MWRIFARAMLARVCSWRAQLKGCAILAALDVREHFDNYFLHARHELTRTQIGNAGGSSAWRAFSDELEHTLVPRGIESCTLSAEHLPPNLVTVYAVPHL
jgi:hypothetical protein